MQYTTLKIVMLKINFKKMSTTAIDKDCEDNRVQNFLTSISWAYKFWFTSKTGSFHDITVTVQTVMRTL